MSLALGVAGCTSSTSLVQLGAAAGEGSQRDASVPLDAGSAGECAPGDVSCLTGGYAHFPISNVAGSGLPREAIYDVTDDLVRDEVTGLVWERRGRADLMGWSEALDFCRSLSLGDRADFRLPARIELVTLLDFEQLPVVAPVLEGFESDYHWTSSPASFVEGSAYSVYFGAGETTIANASPGRARVLCVAGDVAAVQGEPFDVADETARDRATGLEWERSTAPALPHDEAAMRCASLDMRLPSIRELQSIVDEQRYEPAIEPGVFPDAVADGYWSSTVRGADPWYVDFTDGKTYADRFVSESLVSRCVR